MSVFFFLREIPLGLNLVRVSHTDGPNRPTSSAHAACMGACFIHDLLVCALFVASCRQRDVQDPLERFSPSSLRPATTPWRHRASTRLPNRALPKRSPAAARSPRRARTRPEVGSSKDTETSSSASAHSPSPHAWRLQRGGISSQRQPPRGESWMPPRRRRCPASAFASAHGEAEGYTQLAPAPPRAAPTEGRRGRAPAAQRGMEQRQARLQPQQSRTLRSTV